MKDDDWGLASAREYQDTKRYKAYSAPKQGKTRTYCDIVFAGGKRKKSMRFVYYVESEINRGDQDIVTVQMGNKAWIFYGKNLDEFRDKLENFKIEYIYQFDPSQHEMPNDGVVIEQIDEVQSLLRESPEFP